MQRIAIFLLSVCGSLSLLASAPTACAGGGALADFRLTARAVGTSESLIVKDLHRLPAGATIFYWPTDSTARDAKKAEVALLVVPMTSVAGKRPDVVVYDPKPATKAAEWKTETDVDVAGLVFGPQGLDKGKVKKLVQSDAELVTQLADYAAKTAQTETLLEQLKTQSNATSPTSLEAAVQGISKAPGVGGVDRSAPLDQQAAALMRGLNPAIAGYDPLAPTPSSRVAQSAGLAASVAGLFFNSTFGLAAGGAALAENFRTMLFPNTDFRSSFTQSADNGTLTLCAKREAHQARTRLAYLWAVRIPNAAAPELRIAAASHVPRGAASAVDVELTGKAPQWSALHGVRRWELVPVAGGDAVSVSVTPAAQPRALTVDLTKAKPEPGEYRLRGRWDWTPLDVAGSVRVEPLPDLATASLTNEAKDALVHGRASVEMALTGADFQFLESAQLRPDAAGAKPVALQTKFAKGRAEGVQPSVTLVADASTLAEGPYHLLLTQAGGGKAELPVRVLPPLPTFSALPLRVNIGESAPQTITLRGTGLDRVELMECDEAQVELQPARGATERQATVRLKSTVESGKTLDVRMKVAGMMNFQPLSGVLITAPPRPRIAQASLSRPSATGVELRAGELPADAFVTYSLQTMHASAKATLRLACADRAQTLAAQQLRAGEQNEVARVEQTSPGLWFLSMQPGALGQTGCEIVATLSTPEAGESDPRKLGRVVRLPRIDKFTVSDEKIGDALYGGTLEGEHLETIGRAGWDAQHPIAVESLPTPVAGDARRQTLTLPVAWPPPSPRAPLLIWLRGEETPRASGAKF